MAEQTCQYLDGTTTFTSIIPDESVFVDLFANGNDYFGIPPCPGCVDPSLDFGTIRFTVAKDNYYKLDLGFGHYILRFYIPMRFV